MNSNHSLNDVGRCSLTKFFFLSDSWCGLCATGSKFLESGTQTLYIAVDLWWNVHVNFCLDVNVPSLLSYLWQLFTPLLPELYDHVIRHMHWFSLLFGTVWSLSSPTCASYTSRVTHTVWGRLRWAVLYALHYVSIRLIALKDLSWALYAHFSCRILSPPIGKTCFVRIFSR